MSSIVFKALSWDVVDNKTVSGSDYENLDVRYYIYGRTLDDKSISVEVQGFMLYYWLLIPENKDNSFIEKVYKTIKDSLVSNIDYFFNNKGCFKRNIGLVGYSIDEKVPLYPYTAYTKRRFLKLYFTSLADYDCCKKIISRGLKIYGSKYEFEIYGSKVDHIVKFIHSKGISSTGYIHIKNYENLFDTDDYSNYTDISITCNHKHVKPIEKDSEESKQIENASFKIKVLSFDIETQSGDKESFPNPNNISDYIGIIGITTWTFGHKDDGIDYNNKKEYDKYIKKYAITRGSCSPIEDATVYETKSERELLIKYCDLVRELDPDIIIGYNSWGFDEKYIHKRMELLNITEYESMLSRTSKYPTKMIKKKLESSAYGHNDFDMYNYIGRDNMDIIVAMRKSHKLESYSLNSVSGEFLNEHKVDLTPSEVFQCLDGSPDDMAKATIYCIQDTYLPIRLVKKLCLVPNSIEMAGTTYVPNNWLLYRGQQCKAYSLIFKKCQERGFLIPDKLPSDNSTFEGATVLSPKSEAHFVPVAGLDFASLYPSIMMAHNLDYSTLVLDEKYMNLPNVCYETIEIIEKHKITDKNGNVNIKEVVRKYTFVQDPDNSYEYELDENNLDENGKPKPNPFKLGAKIPKEKLDTTKCYVGILPSILKDLKSGRSHTKSLMAKLIEQNPDNKKSIQYFIYDGKQLAQKVTMNSCYGFVGTGDKGVLPCKPIGACVTARGRQMIMFTRNKSEELYNCNALYGDSIPASQYVYGHYENENHYTKLQIGTFACFAGVPWTPYVDNKQQINLEKYNYTTLSGSGPTKINRVIRHKTDKKLYKIKARDSNGQLREVIVTEGHSLITKDNKLIEAGKLKIGTELAEI